MPDRAIARIGDETTREAFLELRSEFYRELQKLSAATAASANTTAASVAAIERSNTVTAGVINSHVEVCLEERRSDAQWRDSLGRVIADLSKNFADHLKSDEKFQRGALVWMIGTLVSLLGGIGLAAITGHIQIH